MEKKKLFENIEEIMEIAFKNLRESSEIKKEYNNIHRDFKADVDILEKILKMEMDNCYNIVNNKKNIESKDNSLKILCDTDHNTHEIFVIVPVFNATDKQAEECIYSVIDNFRGNDYKILIITNRELSIFMDNYFLQTPHYVVLKSLFSLPEAYNELVGYAKEYKKSDDTVLALMDDDAYIFTGQNNKIKRNINLLKEEKYIAVSGHYYDSSPTKTDFQRMINVSHKYKFVKKYRKPYCHGGACFLVKIKNFPHTGLPLNGLGGISINILEINNIEPQKDKWFLYNNPNLGVFHPRKDNLVAWITTYLSYEMAWGRSFDRLEKKREKIWREELKKDSEYRVKGLYKNLKNNHERIYVLGNIYLTRYLKPLLKENIDYTELKKYNVSTHINLE